MLILGIETSGRAGSVALVRDQRPLAERDLDRSGRRHAQTLVAEIEAMFRQCSLAPRRCEGVAVSIGPGSFTGLRVGVVCAKTFAYATGCLLAAVDTFLAVAENSPSEVSDLFVIDDAQRGDLFVGRYRRGPHGNFEAAAPIEIVAAEQWLGSLRAGEVVSGPGLERYESQLPGGCRVLGPACRFPKAAQVAISGARLLRAGRTADPRSLEPFYLRRSAAEEKRRPAEEGEGPP